MHIYIQTYIHRDFCFIYNIYKYIYIIYIYINIYTYIYIYIYIYIYYIYKYIYIYIYKQYIYIYIFIHKFNTFNNPHKDITITILQYITINILQSLAKLQEVYLVH